MSEKATYLQVTFGKAQQYEPASAWTFHCIGCGEPLKDPEFGNVILWSGSHAVEDTDVLEDANWQQVNNPGEPTVWACPKCWAWCPCEGATTLKGAPCGPDCEADSER